MLKNEIGRYRTVIYLFIAMSACTLVGCSTPTVEEQADFVETYELMQQGK